jgi:hypothetical protein
MNNNISSRSYNFFTTEEDNMIKHFYEDLGIKNWSEISQHFSNRSAKIIQNRYFNYIQSNLNYNEWSNEEDQQLIALVDKYGHKWRIISQYLPGRSPISAKNRFVKYLFKRIDKNMKLTKGNDHRTARLVFQPNLKKQNTLTNSNQIEEIQSQSEIEHISTLDNEIEEIETKDHEMTTEYEKLLNEVFGKSFNAFELAFNDF